LQGVSRSQKLACLDSFEEIAGLCSICHCPLALEYSKRRLYLSTLLENRNHYHGIQINLD